MGEQRTGGFSDALGILLVSVPLAILLLTLGAQMAGQQTLTSLPDFVTQAWKSVWTWATGAGGVITILVNAKGKDVWRAYVRWILGTAVFVAAATLGVSKLLQTAPPRSVVNVALRLHFAPLQTRGSADETNAPQLVWFRFDEKEPVNRTGLDQSFAVTSHTGAVKPGDIVVDFPSPGKRFWAQVIRETDDSAQGPNVQAVQQQPWTFCLTRRLRDPGIGALAFTKLECTEGATCAVAASGDPGWFDSCSAPGQTGTAAWIFLANAAPLTGSGGPAWRIPSLATLKRQKPNRRSGYTEFNIRSLSLPGVTGVDTVHYDIKVNGAVVLIDGLPEWSVGLPFKSSEGLAFDFGLENLNFSGDEDGCERIDVSFSFRQDGREMRHIDFSRTYAALRNPLTVRRTLPDGSAFQWGGVTGGLKARASWSS